MHHTNRKFAKLLLASALTAAFAAPVMAQTSVTVSGLIDNYVGSMSTPGTAGRATGVYNSGMSTSWLGFDGSEDLGGGLKAIFAVEAFIQTNNGGLGRTGVNDTLFSRDANVGLSGDLGTVIMGRGLAPNFLPMVMFNPFGDSFAFSPLVLATQMNGNPLAFSTVEGDTGWSNEVVYTTPSFSGLSANVHYQFRNQAGATGKNNNGVNLLYFNGPLSLTAFYQDVQINNPIPGPVPEQKTWFVGGGYVLGTVKLNATYDQARPANEGLIPLFKTISLGVAVPVGAGNILAGWANTTATMPGIAETKRNTTTVGYDYNLSKRTDVYAMLMNDRNDAYTVGMGNSFGLGIRHRF
jgi:predicted porin